MYNIESIWRGMRARCYISGRASYKECDVCDEWLSDYKAFANWFINNLYNCNGEMLELDKDLFSKEKKIYSPDTCCLLPKKINVMLAYKKTKWSPFPTGITLSNNGKYIATIHNGSGYIREFFSTMQDAVEFYSKVKERNIRNVADAYRCYLPSRIYDSLINYKCEYYSEVTSYNGYK